MSLVLKKDVTSVTVTGGTDQTFTTDGSDKSATENYVDFSVTDFRLRPQVTLRRRYPVRGADGTWSKGKRYYTITYPITVVENGIQVIRYEVIRAETEFYSDSSDAHVKSVCALMAQLITSAATASFQTVGQLPA